MRIATRWILVAIIALAPAPLRADRKADAQEHVERARQHFAAGRNTEAIAALQAAYELDPSPSLLYALGTAFTRLGRCTEAREAYERFLATGPRDRQAEQARQAMRACTPAPLVEPAPPPPPPPPRSSPELPAPPPVTMTARPWYSLKLGWVLAGAGAAAGVASGLVYLSARSDLDASEHAATYGESEQLRDDAKRKRLYAALGGGGALVLVGASVGYFLFADRGTERAAVSIVPARSGAAITWTGRF